MLYIRTRMIANFISAELRTSKEAWTDSQNQFTPVPGPNPVSPPSSSAHLRITFDVPAAHVQLREHV